jgi:intracellular septation protein
MTLSPRAKKWVSGLVDFGWPLGLIVGFLITHDMVKASWGLVAGAAIALVVGYVLERRIAPMPLVAGVLAVIFGTLTLVFHDPRFVYVKPTVTSTAFGLFLIGGMLLGHSPLKILLNSPSLTLLALPDVAWRKLTWRYGVFFLIMAGLNEVIWRGLGLPGGQPAAYMAPFIKALSASKPEEVWLAFRFPGATIIHVIFGISQAPLMMKYGQTDDTPASPVE